MTTSIRTAASEATERLSIALAPDGKSLVEPTASGHRSDRSRPRARLLGVLLGVGLIGGLGYVGLPSWSRGADPNRPKLSPAKRTSLSIVVDERGSLESQFTVDGICELSGYQNKITYLVPEGARVKKGDVVCKFDASEIQKSINQQEIRVKQTLSRVETTQQDMEIQRNAGESSIIAATVELQLAELDLEKFQKGDFPAEYTKQAGEMSLKKKDVESEATKLEQYKSLMKRGFKTTEDVRIQTSMLAAKELDYSSARQFLDVKKNYDHRRKTTELTSRVEQSRKRVSQAKATARAQFLKANSECEAAKATADIEQQQLQEYLNQKEKTVIRAAQAGIVAYANDAAYDASRQIREGATVYSRQKIFSLPDLTRMQVKTNIHESLIKKVQPGQRAEVRIDAFPSTVFTASVQSVAPLADSTRHWLTAGIKEYTTILTIDELHGHELKPGMTAETRIMVNDLKDVLVVPLQAVAQQKGAFVAFVDKPEGLEPRKVRIGSSDDKYVEIHEGIAEGESVALDARTRADLDSEPESDTDGTAPGPQPGALSQPGTLARSL